VRFQPEIASCSRRIKYVWHVAHIEREKVHKDFGGEI
jgi:hypothetical protein